MNWNPPVMRSLAVGLGTVLLIISAARSQPVIQRGTVTTRSGQVSHERPPAAPRPAADRQALEFGDRLETAELSWAVVEFRDLSRIKVRELSRLEVVTAAELTRRTELRLRRGAIYLSDQPRLREFGVETPHARIKPEGTEFLIEVTDDETLVVMFDGAAEVSNDAGRARVQAGERGRVTPGKPPETARLEARSLVQWWLYYPAVLDPAGLGLTPEEQAELALSLAAYRRGDLPGARDTFPAGRRGVAGTDSARVYQAALVLSAGAVDRAEQLLSGVAPGHAGGRALRRMMGAVTGRALAAEERPTEAGGWLAESYRRQANHDLPAALEAARTAAGLSPDFSYAWVRVAELEFGFGRIGPARRALAEALRLGPANGAAHALQGFILNAENQSRAALAAFERAIELDPGLGNAWLGRGLTRWRRGGGAARDGLEDIATAAVLEPNRSLLHSYLGKAYGDAGVDGLARKELNFARELDPADPTPWLYSGLLHQEQNEINRAIDDLQRSMELNGNRAVYRSQLLLDQDQAVRGANLAAAFRDAGWLDPARYLAGRAVATDYGNFSAHLFLANSYRELLAYNPQADLRYETPRVSEYLVATLLAPVGAGVLSPAVSQQEYSKLFSRDGLGVTSATEYLSRGAWTQSAAQWGTLGSFSYAVDGYYHWDPGQVRNADLENWSLAARVKQQLSLRDQVFVEVSTHEARFGDLARYYDPSDALTGTNSGPRGREEQEPIVLAGYHREWAPGQHTLILGSRLADDVQISRPWRHVPLFLRDVTNGPADHVISMPLADSTDHVRSEIYGIEAQQVFRREQIGLTVGALYQGGTVSATSSSEAQNVPDPVIPGSTLDEDWIYNPTQSGQSDFERISGYLYGELRLTSTLSLQGGLAYDRLTRPENIRFAPVSFREETTDQLSPKGGVVLTPWTNGLVRAAYSQGLGGLGIEQSYRLEPTQVAGFNQSWRSLMPESVTGANTGEEFETWGAALEQWWPTRTFAAVEMNWLRSESDRTVGAYELALPPGGGFIVPNIFPTTTPQQLDFMERTLTVGLHQLVGSEWSTGVRYRWSDAGLDSLWPEVPAGNPAVTGIARSQHLESTLQQVQLYLVYNHPSGFFGEAGALWTAQDNRGYEPALPGDDFWQFNLWGGYRFPRRRAEIRLGVLNLTDQDYRLNPLNLTAELPRERTFAASLRFAF